MESTNLLHLQDQPPPPSSWTPNTTLNGGIEEANPSPRSRALKDSILIEGLGYEWGLECDDDNNKHSSSDQLHQYSCSSNNSYSNIIKEEEEMSSTDMNGFPKLTEMLNATSTMDLKHFNSLSDKLLLNTTLSSGHLIYSNTISSSTAISRGSFSHIYPTVNISNLNQSSTPISTSFDINNMHSSDLLPSSPTFNATQPFNYSSSHHDALIPRFNHTLPFPLHHDHMQQPIHTSRNSTHHPSHFTNVMAAETKRPNALMESKASQSQTLPKKSRLESRSSSCPPFKVRKEKLGDRIAALQQLVAPFGKTDTASVLMEAIGYIKFLQNQVETLSVPYMKSSGKQTSRAMQGVSNIEEGKEEAKLDLRSRGLCLVPLSCMSYFTADGVWQQSDHFGGPT